MWAITQRVGSENHWILMRPFQRCENKFTVTLKPTWPPSHPQGGRAGPGQCSSISHVRIDNSWTASFSKMLPGRGCGGVRLCAGEGGGESILQFATSGLLTCTEPGPGATGVGSRGHCASSEGGCDCHRLSIPRTAPFEHQRAPWRGSPVAHYCQWHRGFGVS